MDKLSVNDEDLSTYCRAHNVVSLLIDQQKRFKLDRLDWTNCIIDDYWAFEIEVEKDGKIGRASGRIIEEVVARAVASMDGAAPQVKIVEQPKQLEIPLKWYWRLFNWLFGWMRR